MTCGSAVIDEINGASDRCVIPGTYNGVAMAEPSNKSDDAMVVIFIVNEL